MSYTIRDIMRINEEKGMFFFSEDTMKFWKSRVLDDVFQGPGGIYFVTSELSPLEGAKRQYTVRQFNPETGNVWTPSEFYKCSKDRALKDARHAAEVGW